MRGRKKVSVAVGALMLLGAGACSSGATGAAAKSVGSTGRPAAASGGSSQPAASANGGGADPLASVDAASLVPPSVVAKGPYGETSADPSTVDLSTADEAKVKAAKVKVGIVMQTMDIEWSTEQVRGITDEITKLGGTVVGTCNGNWSVDTQSACVDNIITKKPDAIISIPVDDVGMAPEYAKVAAAGIKLIFIDSIGKGLKFPSQYQGMVTSDVRGAGQAAAKALSYYLPKGSVAGILDYGVDFETTKQRMYGFKDWMAQNRSDVTLKVKEFQDPAKSGDDAGNFLTANPDVKGMFTEWEVPAMGILTALRSQNKTLPITDVNLAKDIALNEASGGVIKFIGAQRPYDEGVTEAIEAARAVIGLQNPAFIAYPVVPVLRNNLLSAWKLVYKADAPKEIQDACAGHCK